MDDQDAIPPDDPDAGQPAWTPLSTLSTTTGRTVEALRKAVKRQGFDLPKRRRNDGSWEVLVTPADVRRLARGQRDVRAVRDARPGGGQGEVRSDGPGDIHPADHAPQPDAELLARATVAEALVTELRGRIESLERRLDEAQVERRLQQEAHEAEVDRLLTVVETLAAERAPTPVPQPARRPWPGLRRWLRRAWEGEG